MAATRLAETQFHSSIRGFYVYQKEWVPVQQEGKILSYSHEVKK